MYKMLLGGKIIYKTSEIISWISRYEGCDNRFNVTSDVDYEKLRLINISYVKQNLLHALEDSKVSTCEKIKIIENSDMFNYNIKPNIECGDLYKDWDFTF